MLLPQVVPCDAAVCLYEEPAICDLLGLEEALRNVAPLFRLLVDFSDNVYVHYLQAWPPCPF